MEILKVGPKDEILASTQYTYKSRFISDDHKALLNTLAQLENGKAILIRHPLGTNCFIRDGKPTTGGSRCSTNALMSKHGYCLRHTDTGELVIWKR